jgi:uncharacterized protein
VSPPVAPASRLGAIDALRGLALLGVLTINLETEFRISIFAQFLEYAQGRPGVIDRLLAIFIDLKAFALFSLLFGTGLAIQFDRLAKNPRRTLLLLRRLLVLLGFGLIHLFLIWNGDILTEYALAGLVVLPFLFAPTWVIAGASMVFLALYLLQPVLPTVFPFPTLGWLAADVAEANRVYATGGFVEILSFRIREIAGFVPLHSYIFPRTLGLFLLGALSWRAGLFEAVPRSPRWFWLAATVAIAVGLALTLSPVARAYCGSAGTIALAIGYALLLLSAETTAMGRTLLGWAEPVGRMAFTNYILQSVILSFIFYGFGFGLFGKLDSATGLAIVLAVYAAQVFASRWWLDRFRFGPIEWLWRALMYGRAPPFLMTR